jgi:diguanylate cyclase (GGDEF)-like protein/PAS domain S-box-containing protein
MADIGFRLVRQDASRVSAEQCRMTKPGFPISAKIAAAFGAIFLIVVVVGIMALVRLDAINDGALAARDGRVPSARTLGQLRTSVRMYRIAEATLALVAHDEREVPAANAQLQSAAAAVDVARAACEPFITAGTEDEGDLHTFDAIWAAYQTATAAPRRSFLHHDTDAGSYFAVGSRFYDAAADVLTQDIIDNTRVGKASASAAIQFIQRTRELMLEALVAVVAASAILALLLTRSVSIPIRVTTAAMKRLASRDFAVTIPGVGRSDELGEMADAIEVFRQSLIDREQLRAHEDVQNAALRASELRFREVFDCVHDAIFISDAATGRIMDVNPRGTELFGYERHELIGATPEMLSAGVGSYTETAVMRGIVRVRGQGPVTCEWHCKTKDGRLFWVEQSLRPANFGGQDVVLASVRDISDRREAEQQIRHMARYDGLTGLPNRGVFVEAVERAISRSRRDGRNFAVLFLDLDNFKDVNDTLGHPAGDMLLREVAERLRSAVRETDVVARFGGDEFAVLVDDMRGATDAAQLGDKLIKALDAPFTIQGTQVRTGLSIGIAPYAEGSADVETLMSHADVALYRAKSEGRGTYRFFNTGMDSETRARVALIGELREAITSDQLFLTYQPQVDIASGRITGLEALVRWRHPQRGVLAAEAFVHEAESSGLIVALGRRVLRDACRQAKRWYDAGVLPERMAVNLAAGQLRAPAELERIVMETLSETGLPAERLEMELTESMLMGSSAQAVLARLRARGVKVAIDDFGTGYSCLDYLRCFPVDRVKIAPSFVAQLDQPGNAAVVKATIGLARELHMAVIAEGLETRRQLELLSAWGCAEGQGSYYAQPASPEELEPLLRTGFVGDPSGDAAAKVAA